MWKINIFSVTSLINSDDDGTVLVKQVNTKVDSTILLCYVKCITIDGSSYNIVVNGNGTFSTVSYYTPTI